MVLHGDPITLDAYIASIEDVTVQEGEGTTHAVLTVTIQPPQAEAVLVNYMTEQIIAQAGLDYEAVEGTLTFAAGITAMSVTVPILGDMVDEEDERFQFHVDCADVCEAHAHVWIHDNEALPTVSVGDAPPVVEGRSATAEAVFALSLSEPSGRLVTVSYTTVSETASAGEDFQSARGAVVFQAGRDAQTRDCLRPGGRAPGRGRNVSLAD